MGSTFLFRGSSSALRQRAVGWPRWSRWSVSRRCSPTSPGCRLGTRWLLFGLSIPIALIANTVRITTIALVGYWFGEDAAINIYHEWSSPDSFLVAVILLFLIVRGFEWLNARRTTS